MKSLKSIVFIILLLLPLIVYAEDTKYNLTINNNNITVKEDSTGNEVTDYSNLLVYQGYSDGYVLTLKEGTIINTINYNEIPLTITSNNKVAHVGSINHNGFSTNQSTHLPLIIKNFKNDENTPVSFSAYLRYDKMVVEDSTIYNFSDLYNIDTSQNENAGITIKNSTIVGRGSAQVHPSGPIYISNSHLYNIGSVHSEDSNIQVYDSDLSGSDNYGLSIYTESGNGYMILKNTKIDKSSKIAVFNYSPRDELYNLQIEDSEIETSYVNVPSYNKANLIKNTKLTIYGPIYLCSSSTIEDSEIIGQNSQIYGGNINNSSIILSSSLYFEHSSNSTMNSVNIVDSSISSNALVSYFDTIINNSKIDIDGSFSVGLSYNNHYPSDFQLKDSTLNSKGLVSSVSTNITNSKVTSIERDIKFSKPLVAIQSKIDFRPNTTIEFMDNVQFVKSNIYMEAQNSVLIVNNDKNIIITDDLTVTDKDNVLIFPNKVDMVTRYIYENGVETKSLMFSPKVKIIFKIENGIWEDGSKNDIILEKNYWTDLGTEELPINMKPKKGYGNGKWDREIVFNDLKEEYEYKYIFEKLDEKNNENNRQKDTKKEDKGIINKESNKSIINPETGDKILMLIIISFLSLAVLLAYKKKKRTNTND